jgi:hypothetical protein
LLFPSIVTDKLTIEHKFLSAFFAMSRVLDTPLFARVALIPSIADGFDRSRFFEERPAILAGKPFTGFRKATLISAIFGAVPVVLGSSQTPGSMKSLIYRCINLLVSAMVQNEKVGTLSAVDNQC